LGYGAIWEIFAKNSQKQPKWPKTQYFIRHFHDFPLKVTQKGSKGYGNIWENPKIGQKRPGTAKKPKNYGTRLRKREIQAKTAQ
jgi:hypothetical protein